MLAKIFLQDHWGKIIKKLLNYLATMILRIHHAFRQAPVDQLAIAGRAGFLPSRFEVPAGAGEVAGAAVELAERGIEQVIMPQRRVLAGFVQRANAGVRTCDLGQDNRAVEQVYRRAIDREQGVIEAQDRRPIRFGIARRGAMKAGNGGFQMKRRDDGTLGRLVEKLLAAPDQPAVPLAAVLLLHEQDGTALIKPRLQPGGMKQHQSHKRVRGRRAESAL